MRRLIIKILLLLPLLIGCISCLRDKVEDCPSFNLHITVKDKNYFNVDDVDQEEKLPENLPFRAYIPTLHYTLTDIKTGEMVYHSGVFEVEGDAQSIPVEIDDDLLPYGIYILTVWGGLDDEDPLDGDPSTISFHPDHHEGNDIYLTNDTVVYDERNTYQLVEMERMKGKLIIQVENLPDGYETSQKRITNLSDGADTDFNYIGTTAVNTETTWEGHEVLTKTMLTPTAENLRSLVSVSFYHNDDEHSMINANDVRVTINRNELTVLKYVWNEEALIFDIYLFINDNWELQHGMEVE